MKNVPGDVNSEFILPGLLLLFISGIVTFTAIVQYLPAREKQHKSTAFPA